MMVHFVLLCLCVLGVLGRSSANVFCRTEESGQCNMVDPLRWCQNGSGIGCRSGRGPYKHSAGGRCYQRNGYCGPLLPSGGNGGGAPRNLSVVAVPSSSNKYKADIFVQWEAPAGAITGYEVLVLKSEEDHLEYCACLNQSERHLVIRDLNIRTENIINLQVRSLPYSTSSIRTRAVVKESGARDVCWAAASNQYCTSPQHTMTYTLMEPSAVQVETSYYRSTRFGEGGPFYLMQIQLSWITSRGLGVVIAVNSHTHQSPGSEDCLSPNRTVPCFIATTSTPVILTGLDATFNYTADIYAFNSTLCPGFNPSHLLSGCGQHCCTSPIPIVSPLYATPTSEPIPPPNVTIVKTEFDDLLPNTTSLSVFNPSRHLQTSIHISPSVVQQPLSHSFSPPSDLSHLIMPMSPDFDDFLPTSLSLAGTNQGHPPVTTPSATPSSVTIMFTSHRTSTSAVVENHYLALTVSTVMVGVVTIGALALVLLLVLANKKKKKKWSTMCKKLSERKPRVEVQNAGYRADDCRIATFQIGSNSTSSHPLLASSSSSSATPSPLPANEAISLRQFAASSNAFPASSVRPFTRPAEPAVSVAASSPLQKSLDMTTVQAPPSYGTRPHPSESLDLSANDVGSSKLQNEVDLTTAAAATTPPEMLAGSVLIIYSPSIDSSNRERILQHLVGGLTQYGIPAHCHDTAYIKSPCQWMEQEIQRAQAVLCVCNCDFHREWDEGTARGKIPVVGLLKHLVHATLSRGDNLAKFATVLLDPGDSHWIPSLYLQGDPRQFMVTEVEEIARFVRNVPSYAPPTVASCAPPTMSLALPTSPSTAKSSCLPRAPPTAASNAPPTAAPYAPPTATPTITSYFPPTAASYAPPTAASCAPPTAASCVPPTAASCVPPTAASYAPPTATSTITSYFPPTAASYAPPTAASYAPPTAASYAPPTAASYAPPTAASYAPPTATPTITSYSPPPDSPYIPNSVFM